MRRLCRHLILINPTAAEPLKVARLGGRIAAHIDYALWRALKQHLCHRGVNASAGRVQHHNIGSTVSLNKLRIKHILHISCKEGGIIYTINLRINLCILYSLINILNSNHSLSLSAKEESNGTCAGV